MPLKILKFNESQKRYPKEVDREEFLQKERIHKKINFTENETDAIFSIIAKKKREKLKNGEILKLIYSGSDPLESEFSFVLYKEWTTDNYTISKLDDDWFGILTYHLISSYLTTRYFICDEFEEVINFLADILE